jgi:hypothetical protein
MKSRFLQLTILAALFALPVPGRAEVLHIDLDVQGYLCGL